ncbi:MAG: hypothetical protein ACLFWH_15135 [Actinomycetota bacterium]
MTTAADAKLTGSKYGRLNLSFADIELAHDILSAAHDAGIASGPSEELSNAVNAVGRRRAMTSSWARIEDEARLADMRASGVLNEDEYLQSLSAIDHVYGAMDTAESGFGLELVGTDYVDDLWTAAQARSRVFSLINQFPMDDPTAVLPVEGAAAELLFVGELTGAGASNYDTVKTPSQRVQVDAKKFVIHQMFSGEMEEDSVLAYIPFLRRQAARSVAIYSDSLVLNGDTTNAATGNINLDDADPADTKHYLAFDGIRHAALVDNTDNGEDIDGAIAYSDLIDGRGLLLDKSRDHHWGHPDDPEDLVYVADPDSADAITQLEEVTRVGDRATVLRGQQAWIGLHPLISAVRMSKTEADGKVSDTAANNTQGQVALFNRNGFVAGIRRRLRLEVERLPGPDQHRIYFSLRMGFGRYTPTGSASAIEAAAVLYNITL